MGKLDKPLLEVLQTSPKALTLAEIAQKLDKPEKIVFKTLKRLFEKGKIESKGRQYTFVTE